MKHVTVQTALILNDRQVPMICIVRPEFTEEQFVKDMARNFRAVMEMEGVTDEAVLNSPTVEALAKEVFGLGHQALAAQEIEEMFQG